MPSTPASTTAKKAVAQVAPAATGRLIMTKIPFDSLCGQDGKVKISLQWV